MWAGWPVRLWYHRGTTDHTTYVVPPWYHVRQPQNENFVVFNQINVESESSKQFKCVVSWDRSIRDIVPTEKNIFYQRTGQFSVFRKNCYGHYIISISGFLAVLIGQGDLVIFIILASVTARIRYPMDPTACMVP